MPLTINVGLSRKLSQDFSSVGVSLNVTAELDQGLLARPQELQHQIEELYREANQALDRQLASTVPPQRYMVHGDGRVPASNNGNRRYESNGRYRGNYSGNGGSRNGNGRSPARMTAKQRSAILSIARACHRGTPGRRTRCPQRPSLCGRWVAWRQVRRRTMRHLFPGSGDTSVCGAICEPAR